ncbi:MAG TPA: flagellin [Rhizomicrobium sp.]|jgi:flagellar hook-associated protein 3 FlgL|nr:flagellin [Rhizomicrobium sp.]
MSVDRTSSAGQSQFLLAQVQSANAQMGKTQAQVASGKVSNDYAGLGDKVATLEAARTAANKAAAYQTNTTQAVNQADLQDSQLSSLSDLANQLRQAITTSVANGDGTTLMATAQGIFDQASQILNTKDANGNYLYGGDKDNTAPLNVTSLSQLAALPSTSAAFSNGTEKKSVMVADGQSVQVGVLASDVGTSLMQTLKDIAGFDAGSSGNFAAGTTLSTAQNNFLTGEIQTATGAASDINSAAASNGFVYNQLKDASDHQSSLSTLYQGFVSNIEDVDMPTAITQLNQNQVALQAALQVTAQLNQVSLLNYLK